MLIVIVKTFLFKHVSPFNYAKLKIRSKGKATSRLFRYRIEYLIYPSAETDLLLGLCQEGQLRSSV